MTLEDYRHYWESDVRVSGETFEEFLYGKLMLAKTFIESLDTKIKEFSISNGISILKGKDDCLEHNIQANEPNDTMSDYDGGKRDKKHILDNVEERMFGKVECLGSCKDCKNRDVKSCMISSRFGSEKPSSKQIKYAESIARSLDIPLPICKKKIPYGAFISRNKDNFAYNRATRIWQTDF